MRNSEHEKVALEIAQDCISNAPVLILGSGASAAYGIPGMPALAAHLKSLVLTGLSTQDEKKWADFIALLGSKDLEAALTEVRLSEALTQLVVNSAWDFLNPTDMNVFDRMLRETDMFPLTRLYKHLFNSTHQEIDVVTPNYDRLAEYAADSGGFVHFTGFGLGHLRSRIIDHKPMVRFGSSPARTVNIWKVHGSFDWFRDSAGVVLGLPASRTRPIGLDPVIVTPGIEKYRLTHDEPFLSIKKGADLALASARAYLCIGYGFNDSHVQTKLVERCRVEHVPLVLLTRTISPTANAFLNSGKCKRYLAIEESPDGGSKLFCTEYPGGFVVDSSAYWKLGDFLNLVVA